MNLLRRGLNRHRTELTISFYRLLLYGGLMAIFFGLMAIHNIGLHNPSRTMATTLLTYWAMTFAMSSVYGGYDVGRRKSKPIISGLSLAAIVTDAVTYLQLQIMNVNENNNDYLVLFGPDFWMLLLCIVLQVLFVVFMAYQGNAAYFRLNPPQECLLVLGDESRRESCERKIGRYKLQWKVTDVALWDATDLRQRIDAAQVVFLDSEIPGEAKHSLLKTCYDLHRDVLCKAQLQDIMLSSARQVVVDDAPFLEMDYRKMTLGQRIGKRLMDIAVSAVVLAVLSPVLGIIALCIRMEDGKPVIFRQTRMSVGGRTFTIYKFRTMRKNDDGDDPEVSATCDDDRITRVGKVLRRWRLDELPQLWNILRGDMTLVGPRPEMLENIERYKLELPDFVYREKMKAGLTGYAQIEGRYNTTPEDKLMLDLMYIESYSLWEDIKLLFRTFTVFFKADSTQGFTQPAPAEDDGHHDISA
ncbi:MAG: exopolysaccharide biosynthesis polyprenyl glycosylphosphotransferase [Christensenellaceae bacterium]|nr:exopolysaccharide biosynthesis polyprenyl glycosylphosphotransferase [Christensenellaceae bacterium]